MALLHKSFQAPPTPLTDERKAEFCALLLQHGNVATCCALVGISTTTLYRHKEKDPEFAAAFEEARERWRDTLRTEAVRRGRDGVLRDVRFQGEVVGQERVYSDRLLEVSLKANCPEHRESVHVDATIAGTVGVLLVTGTAADAAAWRDAANSRRVEASHREEDDRGGTAE